MVALQGINKDELVSEIEDAMCLNIYNPSGSDYICGFCLIRARTNSEPIEHSVKCFGVKLLETLKKEDR